MTISKVHPDDPQILGATADIILVATATWCPAFVHPCFSPLKRVMEQHIKMRRVCFLPRYSTSNSGMFNNKILKHPTFRRYTDYDVTKHS
jgi:hypothetical protein